MASSCGLSDAMKPSLLCILEHPTQYGPPLWAAMTRRGRVDVHVWYERETVPRDVELRRRVTWNGEAGTVVTVSNQELLQRLRSLSWRPTAILTAGWTRPRTWWTTRAARALRIPLILPSDKTLNEPSPRQPARTLLTIGHALRSRLFDGFLTTGTLGREQLRSLGVPAERIAAGLYPVDAEAWGRGLIQCQSRSATLRATTGGNFVVLAVSKLNRRENPLLVIEGFARLQRQYAGSRLIYVGDGPIRAEVEARATAVGVADRVLFAGYIPYADLAAFYGAADAFVHVPVQEPWGISVAEAMACGLPVVAATTVGSAADLVISGRTGFLVPAGDADALAGALTQLASGSAAREAGTRARARVAVVDVAKAAEELEGLLATLSHPVPWSPLRSVLVSDVLNRWGRWSG